MLLGLVGVGRGRLEGRAGVLHRLRELLLDLCRLLAVEELEDVVAVGGDGVLGRLDARGERLKVGLLALERIGEQLEVGLGFHTLLVHFVQPFLTLVPLVVKLGDVIPEQLVVRAYQAAPVGYRQELFEVGVELVGILGVAAQIVCDGGEVALIGAFLHEEACVAGAELCDAPGERLYLARVALYVGVALVVFVELAACLLHGAVGILRELDYHDTAGVGVDIGRAVGECLVEGHIAFPFLAVALYTLLCVGEFVAQVIQAFLVGALGVAHGVIALLVGVIFLAGLVAVALGIAYHFVEDRFGIGVREARVMGSAADRAGLTFLEIALEVLDIVGLREIVILLVDLVFLATFGGFELQVLELRFAGFDGNAEGGDGLLIGLELGVFGGERIPEAAGALQFGPLGEGEVVVLLQCVVVDAEDAVLELGAVALEDVLLLAGGVDLRLELLDVRFQFVELVDDIVLAFAGLLRLVHEAAVGA